MEVAEDDGKIETERAIRSPAESAPPRSWNFRIDIVAQSGRYPQNTTFLSRAASHPANGIFQNMSLPTDLPPPRAETPAGEGLAGKIYSAGTLRYTFRGLLLLAFWLLWGDFAYSFFESVFGRFIPLYLKDIHASNAMIGVMSGSFAGLVNLFFLPNISQWSDHARTRFGRRIPFLYVVTPLTAASLVAIGFAPEISGWLRSRLLIHLDPAITGTGATMAFLCVTVVSFHFFNMVLVNSYNWLLRDVVPLGLMARFLSWFRIVGSISSFVFLWFVFPHLFLHRKGVFLGVGLFYLLAFLLMCLNVKEGAYPPPPAKETRPGIFRSFAIYFRECLRFPIYRNFFIAYVLVAVSGCAGPFSNLFMRDTLGLEMDSMGKIFAWSTAAGALVLFPMGWLCDRFNPLSVALAALLGQVLSSVAACLLVHGPHSLLIYSLVSSVPSVAWGLGLLSSTMKLFPEEKFGQFSSGLNVFGCGALILGNFLVGAFMDLVQSDYRMAYLWSAGLFAAAIYPMFLVCRDWRKFGGPHHYVPPVP